MYRIYANNTLIYTDSIENMKIFSPKITLELNKTGNFKFTVYPNHPYYALINKLKTIITVYQDDYLLFRGRVLNDEIGFHNEKKVECEGDLAFLLDSIQRPYDYTGSIEGFLEMLIARHNEQVDIEKQFTVGNVTVTDPNNLITRASVDHADTWDVVNNKLIKLLGGYVIIRHEDGVNYIDYLADFNLLSSQKVEFAKNLLDMKRKRKGEAIATVLIPLGAKIKDEEGNDTDVRLTVADVNEGLDYIEDEEAVAEYGRIYAKQIWDDVTVASNLLRKGKEYLASLITITESIELSAADLATIDSTVTSFHIGTYVKVTSDPHGIDQNFLVSKLSIDLLNPASNKLTLGGVLESFTEQSTHITDNIQGLKGEKGDPGLPGKDGKGVASTVVTYQASTSGTTAPTGTWSGTIPSVAANQYLWTRTVITYTDNTTSTLYSIGKMGADGKEGTPGKDGKGISSVTEYYAVSASGTTAPTTWQNTVPTLTATNKYMWNYESITYSDSTTFDTLKRVIGVYGDEGSPGSPGAAGNGIKTITNYYLASASSSGVTTSTSGWTTTIQTITTSKKYLWNYEVVTYTNNSTSTTTPVIIGVYGNTGAAGKDAAIQSTTAPSDTSYMWLDISVESALLKRYNSTTSTWEAINDTTAITDSIIILQENVYADISKNTEEILMTVAEEYYLKAETDTLISEVSTEFSQTKDAFEMRFNSFETNLADVVAGTDAEFEEIKKYIRFVDGKILLGEVGNQLELQIEHDKISFLQDNAEVAYFSDRKLYVTDGEYTNSLQLGSFAFMPRTNGNLSFKKIT